MHNHFIILEAILKTLMKCEKQDKTFNFHMLLSTYEGNHITAPDENCSKTVGAIFNVKFRFWTKVFLSFHRKPVEHLSLSRGFFATCPSVSKTTFLLRFDVCVSRSKMKISFTNSFINLLSHLWLNECIFAAHKVGQHETRKKVFLSIACREMLIWKLNSYLNNSPQHRSMNDGLSYTNNFIIAISDACEQKEINRLWWIVDMPNRQW